jgi:hypothetical protein
MSEASLNVETLKYGGKLHDFIKEAVRSRRRFSDRKMRDLRDRLDDTDDQMQAYLPEREIDRLRKDRKRTEGDIEFIQLEVPYNFAIVSTFHTYLASVFMSRTPIYQLTGRFGEAQDNVMAMEAMLDYQQTGARHSPVLFNWLYDMSKYGVGIIGSYWHEDFAVVTQIQEEQLTIAGYPIEGRTKRVRTTQRLRTFEGNCLYNVRPHDFYPDPRVPLAQLEKGEFCGRRANVGWHDLQYGDHLNLDVLRRKAVVKEGFGTDNQGSPRMDLPFQPNEEGEQGKDMRAPAWVTIDEFYIRISPADWKLGQSKEMEIWKFTLANDDVVIEARPLGLYAARFPFFVQEQSFGAESFSKRNMIETTKPLNDVLTWLFNSHMYAVRTALNDKRVVDPSKVVMSDVTNLNRNVIRLKPEAYGTDVRQAVHQLQVNDPTQNHLSSMQYVEQMIQRAGGVVDNLMGMVNPGGRKTATEVRNATGMATNRLKTIAEYNSGLAWSPMIQFMIQCTQQLYDGEMQLRTAGNTLKNGQPIIVTPDSIAGFYDFVTVDGTMPIDRLAQANFWKELLAVIASNPQLSQGYDLAAMIAHVMMLQGERNVERFRIQMNSPEQLMQQAQAGNVVPIGGKGGGQRALPGPTGSAGGTI